MCSSYYIATQIEVYFSMAKNPLQFQRPLLLISSIAFLAGMIIAVVSTSIHPSTEDPSNHPLVFAEYEQGQDQDQDQDQDSSDDSMFG
jgi:hypothetical protein